MNRRDFLKTVTKGGAGLIVIPFLFGQAEEGLNDARTGAVTPILIRRINSVPEHSLQLGDEIGRMEYVDQKGDVKWSVKWEVSH